MLELAEWAKMMSDKGICLMDRARPAWWKEVDLTILSSVAYEDDSLLCQLFGSMKTAERRIGKVAPQRIGKPFGLYWDLYGFYWEDENKNAALLKAWRREILKRRIQQPDWQA